MTSVLDKIGRYHLVEEIGRGSMGTVYKGHDPLDDRPVAIKIAHERNDVDDAKRRRFRTLFFNEMRAARLLSHPNIVALYDAGNDGHRYFIVMEYIDGCRTLDSWSRAGNLLPLERVAEVVLNSARALDHAHRCGVIHRDVKPANILVSYHGEVKLADFSVALLTDPSVEETQVLAPVGSPAYMSPEQVSNDAVTAQSDIFSLGNVLYELLTGRLPFAAQTFAGVTHRLLNYAPLPVSHWRDGIPPALDQVVQRALARTPEARYATALEMVADLSMVFSGLHDRQASRGVEGRVDQVRRTAFFADFHDAEIWELLRWAQWQEFSPGEAIVRQHQMEDAVFVLIDGEVDVVKDAKVVRGLSVGECFGEIAYLSKRERSASVVARTAACVLRLNAETIARASLNCQVQFHRVFIETLISRLVHTTEDLVSLHRY